MENLLLETKIGGIKPNYVCRAYPAFPYVELTFSSYEETIVFKQVGEYELKFIIKYDDRNLEIEYLSDINHYVQPVETPVSLLMQQFINAAHEIAQTFCTQREKHIIHHDLSFPVFQAMTWHL